MARHTPAGVLSGRHHDRPDGQVNPGQVGKWAGLLDPTCSSVLVVSRNYKYLELSAVHEPQYFAVL